MSSQCGTCLLPSVSANARAAAGDVIAGHMDSDEVVQLYIKQPDATVPAPQIRLAAFARVHIAAGTTVVVALSAGPETRAVVRDGDDVGDTMYQGGCTSPNAAHFSEGRALSRCRWCVALGTTICWLHADVRALADGDGPPAGGDRTVIERGRVQVFVGGGQPDFYDGGVAASFVVSAEATLASCRQGGL